MLSHPRLRSVSAACLLLLPSLWLLQPYWSRLEELRRSDPVDQDWLRSAMVTWLVLLLTFLFKLYLDCQEKLHRAHRASQVWRRFHDLILERDNTEAIKQAIRIAQRRRRRPERAQPPARRSRVPVTCPTCQAPMRLKSARRGGMFLGCSRWPTCQGSRRPNEYVDSTGP